MRTIKGNVGELFVLKNGYIKDQSGLNDFHPNSNTNLLIINIEDGGGENTMAQINFAPETRKSWSSVWFPLFYRGLFPKKISNENNVRMFAQYVIPVPSIVLAMNLNNAYPLNVKITFRQVGGLELLGIYHDLEDLLREKPLDVVVDVEEDENYTFGEKYSDDFSVAYVYDGANSGFYQVEYNDTSEEYEWIKVDRPRAYLETKHYNMGSIKIQGGFGNHLPIQTVSDEQYNLIWQELTNHNENFNDYNNRLEQLGLDINNELGLITDDIENLESDVGELELRTNNVEQGLLDHKNDKANPHQTTPHKIGTYTDTEIDNKVQGAKDFTYSRGVIDGKDAQVLSEAKAYADDLQEEADLSNYYNKQEVDNKDAQVLIDAKLYADSLEPDLSVIEGELDDIKSNYVPTTRKIVNLMLTNDITEADIRSALLVATKNSKGLMSSNDKTKLESLWELLENKDVEFVDTINEILEVFNGYPEALNLFEELGKKVNANENIVGNTKPKITYDSKGLVVGGENLVESDIPNLPATKITSGRFSKERQHADTVYDDDSRLSDSRTPKPHTHDMTDINGLEEAVDLSDYAKTTDLPTKVSELENDKGYLTQHQDISDYAKKSELPTKTSDLTNDSGFLTQHQSLDGLVPKTRKIAGKELSADISVKDLTEALQVATDSLSGIMSATDHAKLTSLWEIFDNGSEDYVDTLQEVLTIFENYSEGADLVSQFAGKVDKVEGKGLSSNDFTDNDKNKLSGIEAGANKNVKADWNSNSGDSEILNKPSIPSKVSDLSNDKNYLVESDLDSLTSDVKTTGDLLGNVMVGGKEVHVGYNGTTESLRRFKFVYNGSSGFLELWRYTNQNQWVLSTTFPNRNTGSGGMKIEGKQVATTDELFSGSYTDLDNKPTIPTKTSDLTNDSNFANESFVNTKLLDYIKDTDIKNIISDVNYNSSNHKITFSRYDNTDIVVDLPIESLIKGLSFDDSTNELVLTLEDNSTTRVSVGALIGGTVKKINGQTPDNSGEVSLAIPTKVSDLSDETNYAKKTDLFSKNYNDLTNKPTIPTIPNIETNITGSGNVISDIQVDATNKHKLNITKSSVSGGGGLTHAPSDSKFYGSKNGAWVEGYDKTEIDNMLGDIGTILEDILDE